MLGLIVNDKIASGLVLFKDITSFINENNSFIGLIPLELNFRLIKSQFRFLRYRSKLSISFSAIIVTLYFFDNDLTKLVR